MSADAMQWQQPTVGAHLRAHVVEMAGRFPQGRRTNLVEEAGCLTSGQRDGRSTEHQSDKRHTAGLAGRGHRLFPPVNDDDITVFS